MKILKAQWQAYAALYNKLMGESGDKLHAQMVNPMLFQLLGEYQGRVIADLGCGSGCLMDKLADQAQEVIGIDFSEALLTRAQKRLETRQNARLYKADLEETIPIQHASVDIALSIMVSQYLENTDNFAQEVRRILKPGGVFILIIHHPVEMLVVRLQESFHQPSDKFFSTSEYMKPKVIQKRSLNNQAVIKYFHRPSMYYFNAFAAYFHLVSCQEGFEKPLKPRILGLKWRRF